MELARSDDNVCANFLVGNKRGLVFHRMTNFKPPHDTQHSVDDGLGLIYLRPSSRADSDISVVDSLLPVT